MKFKSLPTLAAILAVLLLLSGCKGLSYKTSAKEIHSISDQIAGFTLPQGYTEEFALTLMDYQLVSLKEDQASTHIYLVQAPKDADIDMSDLQKQIDTIENDRSQKANQPLREVHTVETRTVMLRGLEVPLIVGEGLNSQDQPYREVAAVFEGRNGVALVNLSAPVDQWDWEMVDTFLASLD